MQGDRNGQETRESLQQKLLDELFKNARRTRSDLRPSAKIADWKVPLAAATKARTTVTNRWLPKELHMGSLYEVSRQVAAFQRTTTIYKT